MLRAAILGLGLAFMVVGCAHASLSDPVVARTGRADANDGYQAAEAALRADGYRVVEGSQESGYLRVASKLDGDEASASSIEISVWPGSVRLDASLPKGQIASDSEVTLLRREMQELAWAIAGRARALAGEATGSVTTRPHAYDGVCSWPGGSYPYAGGR